jgi:hypothetical protein
MPQKRFSDGSRQRHCKEYEDQDGLAIQECVLKGYVRRFGGCSRPALGKYVAAATLSLCLKPKAAQSSLL